MRALYDACVAEDDGIRASSGSSSAGSSISKDCGSNGQSGSVLDAMRLWVHLQV
jgi:hypothetical protein